MLQISKKKLKSKSPFMIMSVKDSFAASYYIIDDLLEKKSVKKVLIKKLRTVFKT